MATDATSVNSKTSSHSNDADFPASTSATRPGAVQLHSTMTQVSSKGKVLTVLAPEGDRFLPPTSCSDHPTNITSHHRSPSLPHSLSQVSEVSQRSFNGKVLNPDQEKKMSNNFSAPSCISAEVAGKLEKQSNSPPDEPERETWDKKTEFLLAVIGFAVDLGNVSCSKNPLLELEPESSNYSSTHFLLLLTSRFGDFPSFVTVMEEVSE